MGACWNCSTDNADGNRFCNQCGCPLHPSRHEAEQWEKTLGYLMREVQSWQWMEAPRRQQLLDDYAARFMRLRQPAQPTPAPSQPELPQPQPQPAPEPAPPALPSPPSAVSEWAANLSGFLEEKNIRWFHTLGGLLLLAGGIGFLKSEWSTVGRLVVTMLLLIAPALSFAGAKWLRTSLPISSRLLSILGGLLMPTGLMALRQFGFVGSLLPADLWTCGVFLLCGLVLGRLCMLLGEPACLYLATLSMGLSAYFLEQVVAVPMLFGMTLLGVAFLYLAGARLAPFMRFHLLWLGQTLGLVALASTLPIFVHQRATVSAASLFFVGAVFFASSAYLFEDPRALYVAALAGTAFALTHVMVSHLPWVFAAVAFLGMGSVFLAMGTRQPPDSALAKSSVQLGIGGTAAALLLLFGSDLLNSLTEGFARLGFGPLLARFWLALLAAVYYAGTAAIYRRPSVVYLSVAILVYAWFLGMVAFFRTDPTLYALYLALFPLLATIAAGLLRRLLPAEYVEPAVDVAAIVALIPGPLLLLGWGVGPTPPPAVQSWTLCLLGAANLAWVVWRRQAGFLYLALTWGTLCYASMLPRGGGHNPGLAFLPLAASLAAAALLTERRHGRAYALPMAQVALVLLWGVLLVQPTHLARHGTTSVSTVLLLAAIGTGLFSSPYRQWMLGGRSVTLTLAGMCAVLLPAALWLARPDGAFVALTALLAVMLALSRWLRPSSDWAVALRFAVLAWSAGLLKAAHPDHVLEELVPSAFWLVAALLDGTVRVGAMSVALFLVGGMLCNDNSAHATLAAAMVFFVAGYAALCRHHRGFAVAAWVCGALGWMDVLELVGYPRPYAACYFWPFQAVLGLCYLRWRWSLLRNLCIATAVLVLLDALKWGGASWSLSLCAAADASVLCWLALRSGISANAEACSALALLSWFAAAYRWHQAGDNDTLITLGSAVLGLVWLALSTWKGVFSEVLRRHSALLALGSGSRALWANMDKNSLTSVSAALLASLNFGLLGRLQSNAAYYHAAYVVGHLLLLTLLPRGFAVEWVGWPLGLWLMFWSTRAATHRLGSLEGAASLCLLLPPLIWSLDESFGGHAVLTGTAALGLLLYGTGRRRLVPQTAGSLGLLAEALLQTHRVLVALGWQVYATVAGLLLIGLGLLFERRRRDILALGSRLVQQLSGA